METPQPARLNPFAFASDTTLRFVLLFVIVTCASIERWFGIAVDAFGLGDRMRLCFADRPILGSALFETAGLDCLHAMSLHVVPSIALGLVLLGAVTIVIYALYPLWQIRRLRLAPITSDDSAALRQALDSLSATIGLHKKPEFWWNPLDRRRVALAFGVPGRSRIAITGGVAKLCFADPAAFRAIILHELAHVRGRDVSKAYLSLSIWWAFVLTALLPRAMFELASSSAILDWFVFAARFALVALCVLLLRNAVFRARELYADARSLMWHQDRAALAKVLRALSPVPRWRRLISPHPDPARRLRLIENTDEMFRFSSWDAFGIGAGGGVIFIGLALVSSLSLVWLWGPAVLIERLPLASPVFVSLVVMPLMAGSIAIGTWRSALLRLVRGTTSTGKMRVGFACALGFTIGGLLFPIIVVLISSAGIGPGAGLVDAVASGPLHSVLLALSLCGAVIASLTTTLALLVAWIEAIAVAWLAVSVPRLAPGAPFAIGLGICVLVGALWSVMLPVAIGITIVAADMSRVSGTLGILWLSGTVLNTPPASIVAWPTVIALWALPLAAGLFVDRADSRSSTSWAFDQGSPARLPVVRFLVLRAVALGAGGGGIAALALTWIHIPLAPETLLEAGLPATPGAVAIFSRLVSGIAVVGLIAAVVASTTSGLPVTHAMCAGFFASLIIGVVEVSRVQLANWDLPTAELADIIFPRLIFGGALVGLAAATTARGVVTGVRWLQCGWPSRALPSLVAPDKPVV